MKRMRSLLLQAAWLATVLLVGWGVYAWSEASALLALRQTHGYRLELHANSLNSELQRFLHIPATLELEADIQAVLRTPGSPSRRLQANRLLQELNARIGTSVLYVTDLQGTTLVSSNWQRSDSFVGMNFSYRPYFQDAIRQGSGRFYGIGTTSGEPGYYFSYGLHDQGRLVGVAVVKVSLDQLEASWRRSDDVVMLVDSHQVVILSSVPAWKFRTLVPLSTEVVNRLAMTRQYNRQALTPLSLQVLDDWGSDGRLVRLGQDLPHGPGRTLWPARFLMQSQHLPDSDWQVAVVSNLEPVHDAALGHSLLAMVVVGLFGVWLMFLQARQRAIYAELSAKRALQAAHDELERRVTERTADLRATNNQLQDEIRERQATEQRLRSARDELVHAGKLAVLGQLATGISHEINQPLAALRTLSGNTIRFLERGDVATARANLTTIGQLVDRMGEITRQLKRFARKSPSELQAVDVQVAITNALFLFAERLRRQHVHVEQQLPTEGLQVWCDQNRLEQVMVNVIGNALDAMQGIEQPRLVVSGGCDGGRVRIQVRDVGCGLSADVLTHLFEPFFTTKEPGVGLGLGLTISAGILRECGGQLLADNHPEGGAVFTLELPPVELANEGVQA